MDWAQLKPNLAWLVDAGVCVMLDIFVSFQKLSKFLLFFDDLHVSIFISTKSNLDPFFDRIELDTVPIRVLLL